MGWERSLGRGGGGEGREGRPGSVKRSWAGQGARPASGLPEGRWSEAGEQKPAAEASRPSTHRDHFRAMKNALLGLACKFYQASSAAGQIAGQGTLGTQNCQG